MVWLHNGCTADLSLNLLPEGARRFLKTGAQQRDVFGRGGRLKCAFEETRGERNSQQMIDGFFQKR